MPVSNPSYFPPSRTNGSIVGITAGPTTGARVFLGGNGAGINTVTPSGDDLVVIGDHALNSASTDGNQRGTIAIGSQAMRFVTNFSTSLPGPSTVIGFNALGALLSGGGNTVLGANAGAAMTSIAGSANCGNVMLGNDVLRTPIANGSGNNIQGSIFIGYKCAEGGNNALYLDCIVIGRSACNGVSGQVASSILMGRGVASSLTGGQPGVIIGDQAGTGLTTCSSNVIIGGQANASGAASQNVLIGGSSATGATNDSTHVGFNSSALTGQRNITLGARAAFGETATGQDILVIGTYDGGTTRTGLYGNLAAGNILLGNSLPGVNRDFAGAGSANILKLLNGAKGAANPIGGGYFYILAGALHWVGSAGTDTAVAPA